MPNDLEHIEPDGNYQQAIATFRSSAPSTSSCRLVHYAGVDKPNAKDVDAREVEAEIAACVAESTACVKAVDCSSWYKSPTARFPLGNRSRLKMPSWTLTRFWRRPASGVNLTQFGHDRSVLPSFN